MLADQLHQAADIGPAAQGIVAGQGHDDMSGAAAQEIGNQPATGGDDDRPAAGRHGADGDVDRRPGRAIGPQIGDHLQHAQAIRDRRPGIRAMDVVAYARRTWQPGSPLHEVNPAPTDDNADSSTRGWFDNCILS